MNTKELSAFNAWISTTAENAPVSLAGAAKRVPDEDLSMFRDSRLVSSYPSDIPVRGASPKRAGSMLPPAIAADSRRPQSWEVDERKSNASRIDRLIDETVNGAADLSLPPLNSSLAKGKQELRTLLNDISRPVSDKWHGSSDL